MEPLNLQGAGLRAVHLLMTSKPRELIEHMHDLEFVNIRGKKYFSIENYNTFFPELKS